MSYNRNKNILEKWIEKRFLSSRWAWKSTEEKESAKERMFERIQQSIHEPKKRVLPWVRPVMLAASVMLVGLIWYYVSSKDKYTTIRPDSRIAKVVKPGTQSATLTLEDGTKINLEEKDAGVLSSNHFRTIKKEEDGQITYQPGEPVEDAKIARNTIAVPLGGLFEVTLPDGSKVWLNSASTLSYPSRFTGSERRVELSGEAYFEVAKNQTLPFRVTAGDNTIEVTGTRFNIAAYKADEIIKTTLMEGGVTVSKKEATLALVPGQQSISYANSEQLTRREVNADSALGWKNGYFVFDDQDIESVMREVARWYNVEVTIQQETGKQKVLGGIFSRHKSIDELISFLEKLNVGKFEKTGRRIKVMI